MDFRGKMVGNGFPRVVRHGSRGDQVGNGRKWQKMVENGLLKYKNIIRIGLYDNEKYSKSLGYKRKNMFYETNK